MEEELAQLRQDVAAATKVAEDALALANSAQETLKALSFTGIELFIGQGPYAASSPTADGTIPITYKGQRFNMLVDKV